MHTCMLLVMWLMSCYHPGFAADCPVKVAFSLISSLWWLSIFCLFFVLKCAIDTDNQDINSIFYQFCISCPFLSFDIFRATVDKSVIEIYWTFNQHFQPRQHFSSDRIPHRFGTVCPTSLMRKTWRNYYVYANTTYIKNITIYKPLWYYYSNVLPTVR